MHEARFSPGGRIQLRCRASYAAGSGSDVCCYHTLFMSAQLHWEQLDFHGYLYNYTFNVTNDGQLLGHMAKTKISHDASYLSIQMTVENVPWGYRGKGLQIFNDEKCQ